MLNQLLPSNCSPGSKEREVEKKKKKVREKSERRVKEVQVTVEVGGNSLFVLILRE